MRSAAPLLISSGAFVAKMSFALAQGPCERSAAHIYL